MNIDNSIPDSFSFHKKTDGTLVFNVNGGTNTKQATLELVIASIKLSIQQGYVGENVRTIEELLYGLASEEGKDKIDSQKKSGSVSRDRITLDRRKKI